jgi:chemotaxis signal transduction protein
LIDNDTGSLPTDKFSIKPAPKITWNSWLKHVVVRAGELIPLVDLEIVLSPDTSDADNIPVWQRYAPDSGFPDKFFRHEAEVVEFSLLGERYALPKQEVEDDISFKPCRELSDVPPIVAGLAEHNGEILPVIDLAMMFGRRSLATSGWRMMLVNNGDFRALVITEKVFGERRLPTEIHRMVPIHLPHNLMYGCYPDGNAVRIILNVEAISVHFEKSLIQIFMPALSHQMRMSPTGVVYTFPEEITEHAEKVVPSENDAPEESIKEATSESSTETREETPVPEHSEALSVVEVAGFNEESKSQEFIAAESADSAHMDQAATSSHAAPEFKRREGIDEAEFVEWEEETAPAPIAAQSVQIDAADATESDQSIPPEKTTESAGKREPPPPEHDVKYPGNLAEASRVRKPGKQSPLEALRASSRKQQPKYVAAKTTIDKRPAEPIHPITSDKTGAHYRKSREVEQLATLSGNETITTSIRKRSIAYGAIAVLLIAVLIYFASISNRPALETSILSKEPARAAQVQPEQAIAETVPSMEQLRAPLELDIPKNRPTDIDIYVVQEGDTLWSISERFTGNPFNYPRIAGENRIADPDLIFPEQRIRLIK